VTNVTNGISLALEESVNRLILLLLSSLFIAAPAAASLRLEVDLKERELVAFLDGKELERFTVAVGKKDYPTPKGNFNIRRVVWNPSWVPPDSKWARGKTAKTPGHPDNPMKKVKIFFKEPDYYIHGTADNHSLGKAASHGCIRMSEADVSRLGKLVMKHGGKPMPDPWYRRVLRSKQSQAVRLSSPVPIKIN
jgi:lipoprotein-anchoring transpeptidase ErfK/SrfK